MSDAYSPGIKHAGSGKSGTAACSGGCFTQNQVKYQYLSGYFPAHMLPAPSYRYIYILWFVIAFVAILLGFFHWLQLAERTYIGAVWKKWATKNRVYKVGKRIDIYGNRLAKTNGNGDSYPSKNATELGHLPQLGPLKKRKTFMFASFGRLFLVTCFLGIPVCLTLVGTDYIGPNVALFDLSESWPSSTTPNSQLGLSRRAYQTLRKRLQWGIGDFPPVTTIAPTVTLPYRTWWTLGDRTGDMTSALVPLVVVMALKQVPFALFSMRALGGYAFDRLSFLHKWGGRIIWLFATAHLVTWVVQLNKDQRIGEPVWNFVFMWTKFRWGWVSYGFLTAMMVLSIGPIRARFYEFFYIAHFITVAGFMIAAWLHHPPLGQWLYVPLAWWAADRLTRLLKVAWVNGLGFAGRKPQFAITPSNTVTGDGEKDLASLAFPESSRGHGAASGSVSFHRPQVAARPDSSLTCFPTSTDVPYSMASRGGPSPSSELHSIAPDEIVKSKYPTDGITQASGGIERRATKLSARYDPVHDLISDYASRRGSDGEPLPSPTQAELVRRGTELETSADSSTYLRQPQGPWHQGNSNVSYPGSPWGAGPSRPPREFRPRPAMSADVAALIRPGYAFVQLLPGKTLRLTLRTPNKMSWKPGQWVYLNLPGVRWFESHPFTIASAHDADFPVSTGFAQADEEKGPMSPTKVKGEERTIVLLIRARKGFTSYLWDHVVKRRQQQIEAVSDAQPGAHGGYENPLLGPVAIGKGTTGVHMRAIIDGPYGSAKRTNWGVHSTVVIVCGGSGVSFGMSALEHLCACIVGNERLGDRGKGGKNFLVRRIRFVWIMREFAHLQWVAAPLRRCIEMLAPEQLTVELYVTHYNNKSAITAPAQTYSAHEFAPPSAPFGAEGTRSSFASSYDYPAPGARPQAARFTEGPEQEIYEVTANDLTHFEGEDESAPTAAEMEMNSRIRSEGKLRRAATRKATFKQKSGRALRGLVNLRSSSDATNVGTTPETKTTPLPDQSRRGSIAEIDLGDASRARHSSLGLEGAGLPGAVPTVPNYSRRSGSFSQPTRPTHLVLPPPSAHPGALSQVPTPNSASGFAPPYPTAPPSPFGRVTHMRRGSLPSIAPSYALRDRGMPSSGTASSGSGTAFSGTAASPSFQSQQLLQLEWDAHSIAYGSSDSPMVHSRRPSIVHLVSDSASRAEVIGKPQKDDVPIDLDDDEDADLRVVAELARPGHPKLDRIVHEEVEQSHGRILVAQCGPKSLDVVLRSIVSKHINLERVKRGDLRGHVNVVSECFEWGG
ncbi:hypothetical protein ACQY0O_005667 [Thecaphora frezii]